MLEASKTSSQVAVGLSLRGTDLFLPRLNKQNKVKQHDIKKTRGEKIPTIRGERGEIPLLPAEKVKGAGQWSRHHHNIAIKQQLQPSMLFCPIIWDS